MLTYLLFGVSYAFAAAVQPGPLQAYLIAQTLRHGWRRALPAAFSPLLSDGPIIVLVLLVLSRIPAILVLALRAAGGVLLLVLAVGAYRAWRRWTPEAAPPATSGSRSLLGATLVNLLNPGPYLGWTLVMGPLLLKGWHEAPAHAVALLVAFYGTMVGSMVALILLVGTARRLGPRANHQMLGLSALALAALGVFLLASVALGLR